VAGGLPAISGKELMGLLEKDGWVKVRQSTHGVAYTKMIQGVPVITTIQNRGKSLAKGTLAAILGPKQTQLGRDGLKRLMQL
jgi:predicted RNA binding protein YcfA (HicA-like mRNA interferase family)